MLISFPCEPRFYDCKAVVLSLCHPASLNNDRKECCVRGILNKGFCNLYHKNGQGADVASCKKTIPLEPFLLLWSALL